MINYDIALILASNGKSASIRTEGHNDDNVYANIPVVFNYGIFANIPNNEYYGVHLSKDMETNSIILPFDITKRPNDIEKGAVCLYNPNNTSRVVFKANGDIELDLSNGALVKLADRVALVLNQNAVMKADVTYGSSAGLHNVIIQDAGQDKVFA